MICHHIHIPFSIFETTQLRTYKLECTHFLIVLVFIYNVKYKEQKIVSCSGVALCGVIGAQFLFLTPNLFIFGCLRSHPWHPIFVSPALVGKTQYRDHIVSCSGVKIIFFLRSGATFGGKKAPVSQFTGAIWGFTRAIYNIMILHPVLNTSSHDTLSDRGDS